MLNRFVARLNGKSKPDSRPPESNGALVPYSTNHVSKTASSTPHRSLRNDNQATRRASSVVQPGGFSHGPVPAAFGFTGQREEYVPGYTSRQPLDPKSKNRSNTAGQLIIPPSTKAAVYTNNTENRVMAAVINYASSYPDGIENVLYGNPSTIGKHIKNNSVTYGILSHDVPYITPVVLKLRKNVKSVQDAERLIDLGPPLFNETSRNAKNINTRAIDFNNITSSS